MSDCVFCKIIKKEIPADIFYEDQNLIVFKDIEPKAPIHYLIVSKQHIESINHLKEENKDLMGEMFLTAKTIADKLGLKDRGYKLTFNVGRGGGQVIDHLHLHILGGW